LFALIVDGDARQAYIAVALVHIGKQAFKRRVHKFQFHVLRFGGSVQNIVRKANHFAVVHVFHWRIRSIGGNDISAAHIQACAAGSGCA